MNISDDPIKGAGHAVLDWGVETEAESIALSILNLFRNGGEYLGPSTATKTNWAKQPFYFTATRAREISPTAFRLGSDVCNYLPPNTAVEISTRDNIFPPEQIDWPGITAAPDESGTFVSDSPVSPVTSVRPPKPSDQSKPQGISSDPGLIVDPVKSGEPAVAKVVEPPPPPPREWKRLSLIGLGILLVAATAVGALYHDRLRDFACARMGLFCPVPVVHRDANANDERETQAYNQARTCAMADACAAQSCTAPYRRTYPNGRYIPDIQLLEQDQARKCEQALYDRDGQCAAPKESARDYCNVGVCFADYQSRYPNGLFAEAVRRRIDGARQQCDAQREQSLFNEASQCARNSPCNAQTCFGNYRNQFPTGTLRPRMEIELQDAQQRCTAQTPPTPSNPTPTPPPTPPAVVPDGTHEAQRGYTGPRSRSDPRNCPPVAAPFNVRVSGDTIEWDADDMLRGQAIVRHWRGRIDQQSGEITINGFDADPPTQSSLTITGRYDNARIESAFCGSGTMRIRR